MSVPSGLRKRLTHRDPMTHIIVSKLTIIGSDNGLSPSRHQAIIWTNAGILLIQPLGTNFSEILTEIHIFSFKKMHSKMLCAKCRTFCLDLSVLINRWQRFYVDIELTYGSLNKMSANFVCVVCSHEFWWNRKLSNKCQRVVLQWENESAINSLRPSDAYMHR